MFQKEQTKFVFVKINPKFENYNNTSSESNKITDFRVQDKIYEFKNIPYGLKMMKIKEKLEN